MDCISFRIGDISIQLYDNTVLLTRMDSNESRFHRIEMPIDILADALSTARMLRKNEDKNGR